MPPHPPADSTATLADRRDDQHDEVLQAGQIIDHYEVLDTLGHGGMGWVYLALDLRLKRQVALKLVRPDRISSGLSLERFMEEARITARFSHRNIVTIHGVGEFAGAPYLALEYLKGETLRTRLRNDDLEHDGLLRIARGVAAALAEAHRHGVHHLDLKPANIFVTEDGEPKVVDFGLSTAGEDNLRDASPVGTPAYMSPEQWCVKNPAAEADIWAFGVVFIEMFGGGKVFPQRDLLALRRAICASLPAPFARIDNLPLDPPLRELLVACLSGDKADRPSAAELHIALRGPIVTTKPPTREGHSEPPLSLKGLAGGPDDTATTLVDNPRERGPRQRLTTRSLLAAALLAAAALGYRLFWGAPTVTTLSSLLPVVSAARIPEAIDPSRAVASGRAEVASAAITNEGAAARSANSLVPARGGNSRGVVAKVPAKSSAPQRMTEAAWYADARNKLHSSAAAAVGRCPRHGEGPRRYQLVVGVQADGRIRIMRSPVPGIAMMCVVAKIKQTPLATFGGELRQITVSVHYAQDGP